MGSSNRKDQKIFSKEKLKQLQKNEEYKKSHGGLSKEFVMNITGSLRKKTIMYQDHKYIAGVDYVECPICHARARQIRMDHYSKYHGYVSRESLMHDYPDIQFTCKDFINKNLKGQNNPLSKSHTTEEQRKCNSPFSIEFYRKRCNSEEEAQQKLKEFLESQDYTHQRESKCSLIYWLKKGYSQEDAQKEVDKRTIRNGLKWYISKYGEKEGRKKYNSRMQQWINSCRKRSMTMRSKKADECFKSILFNETYNDNIKFGDNEILIENKNTKETFIVDFCDTINKKIIEFNGDYWHCNPKLYGADYYNKSKRKTAKEIWKCDNNRIKTLESFGYQVMIIWEKDYVDNHDEVIANAKKFIFG